MKCIVNLKDIRRIKMGQVHVNEGYELYQIITDFGDPLEIFREGIQNSFDENATKIYIRTYEKEEVPGEKQLIIDIVDNGNGLSKENVSHFFDVANSSKISKRLIPQKDKHGYKGHGAKVFFNADAVQVCSKTAEGEYWAVELRDAVKQIATTHELHYSDILNPADLNMELPNDWESGFLVRIVNPKYFKSPYTRFKLNHINLRDYCKWYTLMGTIETLYNEEIKDKDIRLFLSGLLMVEFKSKYLNIVACDPLPQFENTEFGEYEELPLGHYFPPKRETVSQMKQYVKSIGSNKAPYMYYSNVIYNKVVIASSLAFRLIICLEGYETKRRYDLLLSRQGRPNVEGGHTDGQRYGLWACKGGVPIEKVDEWLEGGRGVGTYTYMQAFIDCDEFQLTANRGSIMNTDIEKLELIKREVNNVFKSKEVKDAIQGRLELEEMEKTITSMEADKKDLLKRYNAGKSRRIIKFRDGTEIFEPTKTKNGYSESETFVVLMTILNKYPDLFKFRLLDYNTTRGIDFVVDHLNSPKYIELKGTLTKKINHPFKLIYKFICYDLDVLKNEIVEDMEPTSTTLKVMKNCKFESGDDRFDGLEYTGYVLVPEGTTTIQSMEIIRLKTFLEEVLEAKVE